MVERNTAEELANEAANMVVKSLVVCEFGWAGRMDGSVCLQDRKFSDAIVWCL